MESSNQSEGQNRFEPFERLFANSLILEGRKHFVGSALYSALPTMSSGM